MKINGATDLERWDFWSQHRQATNDFSNANPRAGVLLVDLLHGDDARRISMTDLCQSRTKALSILFRSSIVSLKLSLSIYSNSIKFSHQQTFINIIYILFDVLCSLYRRPSDEEGGPLWNVMCKVLRPNNDHTLPFLFPRTAKAIKDREFLLNAICNYLQQVFCNVILLPIMHYIYKWSKYLKENSISTK